MVSVIVPVLEEERALETQGRSLRKLCGAHELIFVDGGSADRSREVAAAFGRMIEAPRGRAAQMNAGAGTARGDILFFLHADCTVPPIAVPAIEHAVRSRDLVGGCLTQEFLDCPGSPLFRWIAFSGTLRARLSSAFYGDQGIFCTREAFRTAGGYPDVALFEDVEFSRRLARVGRTAVLNVPIYSSARRWRQHGVVRTTLVNWQVTLRYLLGRSGQELGTAYGRTAAR